MMMQANSIQQLLDELDNIISWSKKNNSRIGYFATLYRRMTAAVLQDITLKTFSDPLRMEKLDTIFGNRYLQAWDAYVHGKPCSRSWFSTFEACRTNNMTVLQHLLSGINTHINLDLAIAAAETSEGEDIYLLQQDFEKINDVIESISQSVQDSLSKIWFPLRALEKISRNSEEPVINFSIRSARKASWANAVAISLASGTQARENYIGIIDDSVTRIGQRIMKPGMAASFILKPVLMMESKNVGKIMDMLKE